MAFSSDESGISMIFSTPRPPITMGTPMNSPCTVLAVEIGRAREEALLIEQEGLGHGYGARGRGVVGAGSHQVDDFAAALPGALDDGADLCPSG